MSRRRIALQLLAAAAQPYRPLVAHVVVTRRCNLSCGYCFEYDKVSAPVPLGVMRGRLDHLAKLGTIFVTLTGGETLLHPDLVAIIEHIVARGMTPLMNTNGYLLTREWIERLNDAGLFGMQLSIDNVEPNDVTVKSLRPLRRKLALLAEHARFRVRVNTVLGSGDPSEALEVVRAATALGFDAQCSLVRDETGQALPLSGKARRVYDEIRALRGRLPALLSDGFQVPLADGDEVEWKCRSGARYFHVCEDGLVHLCAPRSGNPGKPLLMYGRSDIERAFHAPKPCAARCPVAYAHIGSRLDRFRDQTGAPIDIEPAPRDLETLIAPASLVRGNVRATG